MQPADLANQTAPHGTYILSAWLFLRLLGLIYFVAFASLGLQIKGLVGSKGILPAREFLMARRTWGATRFLQTPTLCWWNCTDRFLQFLCWGGATAAVLLTFGFAPVPLLVLLYAFYLSLFNVCRVFLAYQWDILLLETGFLAIFIGPFDLFPEFPPAVTPSPVILWLLWWLVFRLMFSSGLVKLRSVDRTWRNFTALKYHYETQPLPTWTAWYMHPLPAWFHKMSIVLMFAVELVMPVFVFTPPPFSCAAGAAFILLMLLIMATGNYCFFNLLGIALSVLLFDDAFWQALFHKLLHIAHPSLTAARSPDWPSWITLPIALVIAFMSIDVICSLFRRSPRWPRPMEHLIEWLEPFRLVNGYGLFSVMTTERPEIIVEGSNDGVEWRAYAFKWKPGDVNRRPRLVAPHQPRLDWQMWFAALGRYPGNPWVGQFLRRLLQGSRDVLTLLGTNPFPHQPPRFIRAVSYDYRFTDFATRKATGAWWRRERRGFYSPVFLQRGPLSKKAPADDPEP
jgi:hypothetical protein